MLLLGYLGCTLLCIWGGCLIARLIANRLELGLFRRKLKSAATTPSHAAPTPIKRRSAWWTLAALIALAVGASFAFLLSSTEENASSRFFTRDEWVPHATFAAWIVSMGLAAGLALVGFRFDPALGRRRCPKCWYDLAATTTRLCPECGHEAPSERRLYRSRRSKLTIAFALIPLLLVPITSRILYAFKVGPVGLIPTTVMILGWNYLPDSVIGSPTGFGWRGPTGTLLNRLEDDRTPHWQHRLLEWRCQSIIRSSNNPVEVQRALTLHLALSGDDANQALALAPRIPWLISNLSSPDPEAAKSSALLLMYTPRNQSQRHFEASGPEPLLALACGSDDDAAFAACQILSGFVSRTPLTQPQRDTLAAQLFQPASSVKRRYAVALVLLQEAPTSPAAVETLSRALNIEDPIVQAVNAEAILGADAGGLLLDQGLELIRTAPPDTAGAAAGVLAHSRSFGGHTDPDQVRARDVRSAILARAAQGDTFSDTFLTALNTLLGADPTVPLELGPVLSARLRDPAPIRSYGLFNLLGKASPTPELHDALVRFIETTRQPQLKAMAESHRRRLDSQLTTPPPE